MPDLDLTHIKRFAPEASTFTEGGLRYIHLPKLGLPGESKPAIVEGLLCMDQREGYPTRLFFSNTVSTSVRAITWQPVTVAGKVWQAFSWNYISSTDPVAVLLGHLRAFIP